MFHAVGATDLSLVRNMEHSKTSFWLLNVCALLLQCNPGGEGAQTHSLVLYGRNCTWFFLSDMLRFAKQSNKNTIEKVNMGTFILVGRYSGFHGTFDFGIFYFRFQPNTRSKCDTKRPPNELERETIKNSVLKPRTGSEELLKSYKTRFLRLKKKEGVWYTFPPLQGLFREREGQTNTGFAK